MVALEDLIRDAVHNPPQPTVTFPRYIVELAINSPPVETLILREVKSGFWPLVDNDEVARLVLSILKTPAPPVTSSGEFISIDNPLFVLPAVGLMVKALVEALPTFNI